MLNRLTQRMEASLGLERALRIASHNSERFQIKLNEYGTKILDLHLDEMAVLRQKFLIRLLLCDFIFFFAIYST